MGNLKVKIFTPNDHKRFNDGEVNEEYKSTIIFNQTIRGESTSSLLLYVYVGDEIGRLKEIIRPDFGYVGNNGIKVESRNIFINEGFRVPKDNKINNYSEVGQGIIEVSSSQENKPDRTIETTITPGNISLKDPLNYFSSKIYIKSNYDQGKDPLIIEGINTESLKENSDEAKKRAVNKEYIEERLSSLSPGSSTELIEGDNISITNESGNQKISLSKNIQINSDGDLPGDEKQLTLNSSRLKFTNSNNTYNLNLGEDGIYFEKSGKSLKINEYGIESSETPTTENHLTNKKYVDEKLSSLGGSKEIQKVLSSDITLTKENNGITFVNEGESTITVTFDCSENNRNCHYNFYNCTESGKIKFSFTGNVGDITYVNNVQELIKTGASGIVIVTSEGKVHVKINIL